MIFTCRDVECKDVERTIWTLMDLDERLRMDCVLDMLMRRYSSWTSLTWLGNKRTCFVHSMSLSLCIWLTDVFCTCVYLSFDDHCWSLICSLYRLVLTSNRMVLMKCYACSLITRTRARLMWSTTRVLFLSEVLWGRRWYRWIGRCWVPIGCQCL